MTQEQGFTGNEIRTGAQVFTADGENLGTVKEVAGDSFKIDAAMKPDYWLDRSTVDTCTDDTVTVGLTKNGVEDVKIKR